MKSETFWIMLITKLSTQVSPPKMSIHYSFPWPDDKVFQAQKKRFDLPQLGNDRVKEKNMFNDKLLLRPVMRSSYLIQRLHKPLGWKVGGVDVDNPFAFGGGLLNGGLSKDAMNMLRKVLSFDYMGSSEFEWGAVPAALQFLAENASKKNLTTGTVGSVYYIAPKEYEEEVKTRIAKLADNEYCWQKKEYCGLHDKLTDDSDYHQRNVGWLELDNGYAFFVDREMYEQFCDIFAVEAVPVVPLVVPKPKLTKEAKIGGGTVRMSEGVTITVDGKPLKTKKIKTEKPKSKSETKRLKIQKEAKARK